MTEQMLVHALPLAVRAVAVRAAKAAATGRVATGDREDFEQEALLRLVRALPHYDNSRAGLRTFLEQVAERQFASLLRRSQRPVAVPLDGRPCATLDGIPAAELRTDFQRILAGLPEPERRLAWLLTEHSPSEAARMLGLARSTVYCRLRRLRAAFLAAGYGPLDRSRRQR